MYSFHNLESVVVPCLVLTVASWPAYRFLRRKVSYSHLLKNFPQFVVIHTVNKAEIDVLLEPSCFFHDPADVGNLISDSSAFSKTSLNIWKFTVHVLLKPGLENFEHYFTSMWDECNCAVVWAFFGIFPGDLPNPGLLHCRWILYQLSHKGSPYWWIDPVQELPSAEGSPWPKVLPLPGTLLGWGARAIPLASIEDSSAGPSRQHGGGLRPQWQLHWSVVSPLPCLAALIASQVWFWEHVLKTPAHTSQSQSVFPRHVKDGKCMSIHSPALISWS